MTAAPAGPAAAAAPRYPVRHRTDGDFTPAEMLTTPPAWRPAAPLAGVAEAALNARLWHLQELNPHAAAAVTACRSYQLHPDLAVESALLHAVETSPLARPPVADRLNALTPVAARAWLTLATHWVGLTTTSGDLRFFNAACKLLGAVWIRCREPTHNACATAVADLDTWPHLAVDAPLATVAQLIDTTSRSLAERLARRLLPTAPAAPASDLTWPAPATTGAVRTARIVLLAGAGSASPARLAATGIPLAGVCWYGTAPAAAPSGYADAWYPPPAPAPTPPRDPTGGPAPITCPQASATSWDGVAVALRRYQADLVILLGMPIVPPALLDLASIGVLNAHNGALPHYRGMDAVAWALLNNDPVVCSLHRAVPAVDAGDVLAAVAVPLTAPGTLKDRVKTVQLQLLLDAAAAVTATGHLPDATAQQPQAERQFYRLHPHLKRLLDASPYAHPPLDRGKENP
ncbi:formyltransferase family protein [Streptosporangium canum]|uniref:formyltransferase family protein n=1 Tax=Streptosporangium canum TaxID=324952 RepID=UPI003789DF9A